MKIEGVGIHRPSGFRNGLQGVPEQVLVVGFKFDDPVFFKDLIINRKKPVRGQPSLGVTVLGPRIREIQIDPGYFIFSKNFRKITVKITIKGTKHSTISVSS